MQQEEITEVVQDLAQIKALVSTPLPKHPEPHREHLNKLASWLAWISEKVSLLEYELAKEREKHLPPKTKELTELDRSIQLEANTAETQRRLTLLKKYEKAIYTIISIGQTQERAMSIELQRMRE